MFYALQKDSNTILHISEVYDFNATFRCLNPECTAEYTICSPDGVRKKHFRRRKTTPHIPNCFYQFSSASYLTSDNIHKATLEDIYQNNNLKNHRTNIVRSINDNNKINSSSDTIYIRTPKQLLNYCLIVSV